MSLVIFSFEIPSLYSKTSYPSLNGRQGDNAGWGVHQKIIYLFGTQRGIDNTSRICWEHAKGHVSGH